MRPRAALRAALLALAVACTLSPTSATHAQQPAAGVDSILPAPEFPAVVSALADPARALGTLDREIAGRPAPPPIEALVLRAHLLSDLRRFDQSVGAWDAIASRDGRLHAFAERSSIADLLSADDVDGATPRIDAVVGPRPRPQHDLLLLSLADACRRTGRAERASALYRGILGRERDSAVADRARLGLAAAEEAAGHAEAALEVLHQATITWRLAETMTTARSEERRISAVLHREPAPMTADQYFSVAARLAAISHFDDAVALLEEGQRARRVPASDRLDATVVENLYRARRNDVAMDRANRFLTTYPGSRLAASVRLIQLRLDVRTGRSADARRRLDLLLRDRTVPTSTRLSAERMVAANLVAEGHASDGLALYRDVLRTRLPRRDRFDLLWRAGIAAIRAGSPRAAADLFRQARKTAPGRSTPRSVAYWLAVALADTGQAAEARRLWEQLAAENACDYYGLRAGERLGRAEMRPGLVSTSATGQVAEPETRPGLVSETARAQVAEKESRPGLNGETRPGLNWPLSDTAAASDEVQTALVLARAGLTDEALSWLRTALARFRNDAGLALLTARVATAAGDYATAASIASLRFGYLLANPADATSAEIWRMAFPLAFWNDVRGAAKTSTVDPLLLLSLMRRESRFVVAARSRTGALGLFQIMPDTAREIEPTVEEVTEGERLTDAPGSADLAARLVRRIMNRFEGAVSPVVASYNAGEDRVEAWWRAAKGTREDLFVDSIPYGETRQYVREVLANYAAYKRLYAGHS